MPRLSSEQLKMRDALVSAFPSSSQLAHFLRQKLGLSLELIAPTDQDLLHVVSRVIESAESTGRLEELVVRASEDESVSVELRDVLRRLRPTAPYDGSAVRALADPFQTCFVGGRPFIGRRALRQHLRNLAAPSGSRVLLVEGPPGSGKSYTLQFIAYLAAQLGSFKVGAIRLEDEAFYAFGPSDVARSLAHLMGRSVATLPAQADDTASRWTLELRDWLLGEILQSSATWWFILDGFDHPDIPLETRDFIKHLVVAAHRATTSLRVVLLGWSDDLVPLSLRASVLRETVAPLDRADLVEFFRQVAEDRMLRLDSDGIDQVVHAVLKAAAGGHDPSHGLQPTDLRGVETAAAKVVELLQ
jgi:Effector-associated domain 1/NACHT domain